MKKAGCLIALLGLVAVGVSISLFGLSVFRAVNARPVVKMPLKFGAATTTGPLTLNPQHCGLVAVKMDISGKAAIESDSAASGTAEHQLAYEFAVSYQVTNDKGETIASQKTEMSPRHGAVITTDASVTSNGGKATIEHSFEKFNVPDAGKIVVQVTVQADTTTGAKAKNMELIVYDNVYRHGGTLAGGFGLACIAPLLVLLGLAMFIAGLASGRKKIKPTG